MANVEKSWINPKDIQSYAPDMSIQTARKIAKSIQQQMISEGAYIIKSKSTLVPRKRVERLFGLLEEGEVHEQSSRNIDLVSRMDDDQCQSRKCEMGR